ncbi:unnamed protein product, partial [Prorocentrum cordatum]
PARARPQSTAAEHGALGGPPEGRPGARRPLGARRPGPARAGSGPPRGRGRRGARPGAPLRARGRGGAAALAALLLASAAAAAAAEAEAQLHKLAAEDGQSGEEFGKSVAISSDGSRVVVGASGFGFPGSAHVFDGHTGARLNKFVAADGATNDQFGHSVSVSSDGSRIAVGAPNGDGVVSSSGSAYVFDGATGARLLKIVATDGAVADRFGNSVSMSSDGSRMVVGAHSDDDVGSSSGSAYVFNGATGVQLHKLVSGDGSSYDIFGFSVSMSSDGSWVVVGAYKDDDVKRDAGAAYIFDAVTGVQLRKLVAEDAANNDQFGYSVAVSPDGSRVVVAAPYEDHRGNRAGAVYMFDRVTGAQLHKFVADDGDTYDTFGFSVSVSSNGNSVVVGVYGDDDLGSRSGSVYVFNGTTGTQIHKIVADDGSSSDNFGCAVCVNPDGSRAVVGACNGDVH